ncbi:MAG: hypothetical protein D6727_00560 [Gammaproteobacteria bacterium]|nr:MAG: hypothetical protein D6727_00560 [Gammaproteobacteria bacterium]
MTIAYWTVLFAALLPLVWTGVAKSGASGYDNRAPRAFLAQLEGWPQRANWAQLNALEAFPPFAAGVIIAHLTGGEQWLIDTLAGTFLLMRVLHGIFYILDRATLRSLVWLAGFLCVLGLFLSGG